MIKYSREFYKKSFTADTMKLVYMSAVKWYSTNVLSKAEFVNVQVQFIKRTKANFQLLRYICLQFRTEKMM